MSIPHVLRICFACIGACFSTAVISADDRLDPQRTGEFGGFAQGLVLLEACSEVSPALHQRYQAWLDRPYPDLKEFVAQARALPQYPKFKHLMQENFQKFSAAEVAKECESEFNNEVWPSKRTGTHKVPSLANSAASAPNPSIERTSPGKPGDASHVKR